MPLQMGNLNFHLLLRTATPALTSTNWPWRAITCGKSARAAQGRHLVHLLRGHGALDLSTAARQAAKEVDLDRGLSQFIDRFPPIPSSFARHGCVSARAVKLGQLPGTDYVFDLVIRSEGMLLLHGTVSSISIGWSSASRWTTCRPELPESACLPEVAELAEHRPLQQLFQTRHGCMIPVLVRGSKLRAGVKPLRGDILLDTNGGALAVPVRADIPVRPFPKGSGANESLAGVRTPRELAVKAKACPKEAGVLFEQGAVKAWYASNGWTYPIQGSDGMGAGAVQQFFEVLGLTKPPRLEIDTGFLMFRGKIGESHVTRVCDFRTQDAKPSSRTPGQSGLGEARPGQIPGQQGADSEWRSWSPADQGKGGSR